MAMTRFENQIFQIAEIRVPVKRRKEIDPQKVAALAETLLAEGQKMAILVRKDEEKGGYVLIEGLHRLEALKSLGETTIIGLLVRARRH
jgi:ParB-like chromosome segregation protein Spo0J